MYEKYKAKAERVLELMVDRGDVLGQVRELKDDLTRLKNSVAESQDEMDELAEEIIEIESAQKVVCNRLVEIRGEIQGLVDCLTDYARSYSKLKFVIGEAVVTIDRVGFYVGGEAINV